MESNKVAHVLYKTLQTIMMLVFIGWMIVWIMRPTLTWKKFYTPVVDHTRTTAYGSAGPALLIYAAPIVFIAFVGAINMHIKGKLNLMKRKGNVFRHGLNPWAYPAFIRGPFSLVSLAEIAIFCCFVILAVWSAGAYIQKGFNTLTKKEPNMWQKKLEIAAAELGSGGVVLLALLFIPVSRRSVCLRLLNIPFEHAITYHIWLGHLIMITFSAHGISYLVYYGVSHELKELITWELVPVNNISGLIALVVGLIMWATSLQPFRKKNFELFFYSHQLYVLFIVMYVIHVGDRDMAAVMGGIMLFCIDRYLRFLQSRKRVQVVSTSMLSSETLEFVIARKPNVQYDTGSLLFLNVSEISLLQWHPFTIVSSSNTDEDIHLLIKCNGSWTKKLRALLEKEPVNNIYVLADGPYGDNFLDSILIYDVLIFVAGGSGISPFISILKDVLYTIKKKEAHILKEIKLIWVVKNSEELKILNVLSPSSILPGFEAVLKLEIDAYVTREDGPDPEGNCMSSTRKTDQEPYLGSQEAQKHTNPKCLGALGGDLSVKERPMCAFAGTNNNLLFALVLFASFAGYMIIEGLIHALYIYPIDHNTYKHFSRSGRGMISLMAMLLGVFIFGGATAMLSMRWLQQQTSTRVEDQTSPTRQVHNDPIVFNNIYHSRPNFDGIFSYYAKQMHTSNIGVYTCGPEGLQQNVAFHCQTYAGFSSAIDFHPLSYDL